MKKFKPENFQAQDESGECALACIVMICRHFGRQIRLSDVRRHFPLGAFGSNARSILRISENLDLSGRALKLDVSQLKTISLPVILHWEFRHFIVLTAIKNKKGRTAFEIADPARGVRLVDEDEISRGFTGVALQLTPSQAFNRISERPRLTIKQLYGSFFSNKLAIAKVLGLSLTIQIASLIIPFYMMTSIDSVIQSGNYDLAIVLFVSFLGVLVVSTASSWARSEVTIALAGHVSHDVTKNLFKHLLHLPLGWFENRRLGDITSKFASVQPLNDAVTKGLAVSVIDGLLAVSTLAVMAVFSWQLTLLTVVAVFLIVLLSYGSNHVLRASATDIASLQGRESAVFVENIRAIQTIKSFAMESSRLASWENIKIGLLQKTVESNSATSTAEVGKSFLVGVEALLFIFVGSLLVIDGKLTLGVMFALLIYKQNFVSSSLKVFDQLFRVKLMSVHLDKLSDIAFSPREPYSDEIGSRGNSEILSCELNGISFGYSSALPAVLMDVSFSVSRGQHVAIIGGSGSGKSTLLKVLTALIQPQKGELRVNGKLIQEFGVRRYREMLGTVTQNDQLFSGSILENIVFFERDYDFDLVVASAKTAEILGEIEKFPMGFDTQVGDLGGNLSGGQKQRILLSRALYRKPELLILDEATAHLDARLERKIVENLKVMRLTIVSVAHRLESIRYADRIFDVSKQVWMTNETKLGKA